MKKFQWISSVGTLKKEVEGEKISPQASSSNVITVEDDHKSVVALFFLAAGEAVIQVK